jgi:hypothetical protein
MLFACFGAMLGLGIGLSAAVAVPTVGLAAAVATHGLAPFMPYASRPARLAAWSVGVVVLASMVPAAFRRAVPGPAARAAAYISAALLFLKAAVLLHPDVVVGDIMFHVHRFQNVVGGHYFFLSAAPGGEFPYPIALYVAALPFVEAFRNPDVVLRLLALAVNALAGLALFGVVLRAWGSATVAIAALVIMGVTPIDFQIHARAFLTNAFGNAAAVLTMAMVAGPWFRGARSWAVPAAAAACVIALTSHVSTAVILTATLAVVAVIDSVSSDGARRQAGRAAGAVLGMGVVVSVVLYYGWFGDFYRARLDQWRQPTVSSADQPTGPAIPMQREEAHQTRWAPGWVPLKNRAAAVPRYAVKYFGGPLIALALLGFASLARRCAADRLARVASVWVGSCAMFLMLGLLTPIDLRYYLAVYPALAVLGAYGLGWALQRGALAAAVVTALAGWACVSAAQYWLSWLG